MKRFFKWVGILVAAFFVSTILAVVVLKWVPVYYTPLMITRTFEQRREGKPVKISHKWVPLEDISANLPLAVVASEDQRFMTHNGFDVEEIKNSIEENKKGKRLRGASTISQQTAKNVFLWEGRNFVRKGLEAYFTVLIEMIWGKERIMEVYLNSIEIGDGIYGAEAVANENFGKSASSLTREDAALIAASLPAPLKRDSAHPSKYMQKRKRQILKQMHNVGKVF